MTFQFGPAGENAIIVAQLVSPKDSENDQSIFICCNKMWATEISYLPIVTVCFKLLTLSGKLLFFLLPSAEKVCCLLQKEFETMTQTHFKASGTSNRPLLARKSGGDWAKKFSDIFVLRIRQYSQQEKAVLRWSLWWKLPASVCAVSIFVVSCSLYMCEQPIKFKIARIFIDLIPFY